jgi:hypothetical protein
MEFRFSQGSDDDGTPPHGERSLHVGPMLNGFVYSEQFDECTETI